MNRLFTLLQTFLASLWNFFRIPFPTTNIPIGALLFLPMVISLAIALFRNLFGIGSFAEIVQLPFKGMGRINRIKQSRYDKVTSHADDVANTLSKK